MRQSGRRDSLPPSPGVLPRLILCDELGMGLSDRDVSLLSIDNQPDEVLAVMAAGAERPVAHGAAPACPVAASDPERVEA